MLTKLTLTIEKEVIERAKSYARSEKRSVSRLVEEYLRNITGELVPSRVSGESPVTDELCGVFMDDGSSYEEMRDEVMEDRFF